MGSASYLSLPMNSIKQPVDHLVLFETFIPRLYPLSYRFDQSTAGQRVEPVLMLLRTTLRDSLEQ